MSQADNHDGLFSFLEELESAAPVSEVWVDAGSVEQVLAAGLRRVKVNGRPVGVMALPGGSFLARELTCKHQGADLSAGPRNGNVVVCPRHSWEYDLHSGQCLTYPGSTPLRGLTTRVRDGRVEVCAAGCPNA